MSRFKAFAIHFGISLLIFLVLLYFILVQWYPQPLFSTDGGWKVIRIIAGVDLVLGPLLTLIVFKAGKPGLKFDLSMVALVQVLALSWGIWISYYQRPLALIYTVDYFTPVPAYQLAQHGITPKKLKQFGNNKPAIIYSDIPKKKELETIRKSMQTNTPLYLFSEYYSPLAKKQISALKENSMNIKKYVKDKPILRKLYQQALLRNIDKKNISYLPLRSREKWVTAIFDLDSMKIIDTINIEPSAYTHSQKIKKKEE